MYHRRYQEGEYHESSIGVDAACSCYRRCTGKTWPCSLWQGGSKVGQIRKAMAPVALPIRSDRAIFGIPVAAYLHWSNALQNTQKSEWLDNYDRLGHGCEGCGDEEKVNVVNAFKRPPFICNCNWVPY